MLFIDRFKLYGFHNGLNETAVNRQRFFLNLGFECSSFYSKTKFNLNVKEIVQQTASDSQGSHDKILIHTWNIKHYS